MSSSCLRLFRVLLPGIFMLLAGGFVFAGSQTFSLAATDHTAHSSMTVECAAASEHKQTSHSASHAAVSECEREHHNQQTCCGAACASVMAFVPHNSNDGGAASHLALIPLERQVAGVDRPRSLYRPPIA